MNYLRRDKLLFPEINKLTGWVPKPWKVKKPDKEEKDLDRRLRLLETAIRKDTVLMVSEEKSPAGPPVVVRRDVVERKETPSRSSSGTRR